MTRNNKEVMDAETEGFSGKTCPARVREERSESQSKLKIFIVKPSGVLKL